MAQCKTWLSNTWMVQCKTDLSDAWMAQCKTELSETLCLALGHRITQLYRYQIQYGYSKSNV